MAGRMKDAHDDEVLIYTQPGYALSKKEVRRIWAVAKAAEEMDDTIPDFCDPKNFKEFGEPVFVREDGPLKPSP